MGIYVRNCFICEVRFCGFKSSISYNLHLKEIFMAGLSNQLIIVCLPILIDWLSLTYINRESENSATVWQNSCGRAGNVHCVLIK